MKFPWWVHRERKNPVSFDPRFYRKRWELYERHIAEVFARNRIYIAGDNRATITKSTRPGVAYQMTMWVGQEPVGHLDLDSLEQAARQIWTFESQNFKNRFTEQAQNDLR